MTYQNSSNAKLPEEKTDFLLLLTIYVETSPLDRVDFSPSWRAVKVVEMGRRP